MYTDSYPGTVEEYDADHAMSVPLIEWTEEEKEQYRKYIEEKRQALKKAMQLLINNYNKEGVADGQ